MQMRASLITGLLVGGLLSLSAIAADGDSSSTSTDMERWRRTDNTKMTDEELRSRYGIGTSSDAARTTGSAVAKEWLTGKSSNAAVKEDDRKLIERYGRNSGAAQEGTTSPNGQASVSDPKTSQYVNELMGVQDVNAAGRGVTSAGAGNVTLKGKSTAVVTCSQGEQRISLGGYAGFAQCAGSSGVSLRLCAPGKFCSQSSDYLDYSVTPTSPVTSERVKLSVEFAQTGKATISLETAATLTASDQQDPPPDTGASNSYQYVLAEGSSGEKFRDAADTHGREAMRCVKFAADGITCALQEKANLGTLSAGTKTRDLGCGSAICVRQSTTTNNWTESCERSFDTTTYSCSYVRAPLMCSTEGVSRTILNQCSGSECEAPDATAVATRNNLSDCTYLPSRDICSEVAGVRHCTQYFQCATSEVKRTCDNDIVDPESKGYVKLSSEPSSEPCSTSTTGSSSCTKTQETWLGPESATGNCEANPLPVLGSPSSSCENGGAGTTRSECSLWYGRTMTTDACTVTDGEGTPAELDESLKAGCGYCLRYSKVDECLAEAPVSSTDCAPARKANCSLASTVCSEGSPLGGTAFCLSQRETYNCTAEQSSCLEWAQPTNCSATSDLSGGITDTVIKNRTSGTAAFGQAAASLAAADAVAQSAADTLGGQDDLDWFIRNGGLPRIFKGAAQRCSEGRHKGLGGGVNCCKTSLERPKAGMMNSCDLDDVKLAAYRRKNQTHYVGRYCADKIKIGGRKICVEYKQSYCSFEGILPRIIQEQGRQQLKEFAATDKSGTVTVQSQSLAYHAASDLVGSWSSRATTAPGINVHRWQWPGACQAAVESGEAAPEGVDCPTVPELWWATCLPGANSDCSTPPATPYEVTPGWTVARTDPLRREVTPIHRLVWVDGSCNTENENCTYTVSSWPASTGGRAVVSRDTEFYATTGKDPEEGETTTEGGDMAIIGNTVLRPMVYRTAGAAPNAVILQFSFDNGATWQAQSFPVTPGETGAQTQLVGSEEGVQVQISCKDNPAVSGLRTCKVRAVGTVAVTTKPWGEAKYPDCSGFTMGQFTVLDFSRMDLSEWIAHLTSELGSKLETVAEQVKEQATAMSETYLAAYGGSVATDSTAYGLSKSAQPQSAQAVWITPRENYGPFTAKIKVAGNWPQWHEDATKNTNPVTSVRVDWNDCTIAEDLAATLNNGKAAYFSGEHRIASPDDIKCGIGGEHDINHKVKVTVTAQDGAHELVYTVRNVWKDFQGNVIQSREEGSDVIKQENTPGATSSDRGTVTTSESMADRQIEAEAPGTAVMREETNRR